VKWIGVCSEMENRTSWKKGIANRIALGNNDPITLDISFVVAR
jgi:hypothetical protein